MKRSPLLKVFFPVIAFCVLNIPSFGEDLEHPIIKPIPKSFLERSSEHRDYTYEFPYYDKDKNIINYKPIKGTLWKLGYKVFGKDNQRVDGIMNSVEIIRAYRSFAIEKGGKIFWERAEGGRLTFSIPSPTGGNIWCQVFAGEGFYELEIVGEETTHRKDLSSAEAVK